MNNPVPVLAKYPNLVANIDHIASLADDLKREADLARVGFRYGQWDPVTKRPDLPYGTATHFRVMVDLCAEIGDWVDSAPEAVDQEVAS